MRASTEAPNPVCTEDSELPPPPDIDFDHDPARPHPDEPGVGTLILGELAAGRAAQALPAPSAGR
jgi:hypothetical protein